MFWENEGRTNGPRSCANSDPALTETISEDRMAVHADSEEWRLIKEWPAYEVSSHGRVRRVVAGKGTQATIMKLQVGKRGYPVVGLTMMPRRQKIVVHRLVCEAFHGPAPQGNLEVAHGDGVRTNNRADNLRWATRRENRGDALLHGTHYRHPPVSPAICRAIRQARLMGLSYSQLAARFPVSQGTAWKIVTRKGVYRQTEKAA